MKLSTILRGKTFRTCSLMAVAAAVLSVPSLAADPDISSTLTTAFQAAVTDMMNTAVSILPIALTVLGLSVTIGFAVKWFKKLIGKA